MPLEQRKHGWQPDEWQPVANRQGVLVGKFKVPFQPAQVEVEVIRNFLIRISQQKQQEERMSNSEKVNMVWLAGTVKLDPKIEENGTRCLIDVGLKNAIPVGARKSEGGLADKLARFQAGDFIKVVCMLDPYGVKQADGSWKNGMGIQITEIKNAPPPRKEKEVERRAMSDDDIPF